MVCQSALDALNHINEVLTRQFAPSTIPIRGHDSGNGFDFQNVGKTWVYEKTTTLAGTTTEFDIQIQKPSQLNRIELDADDATAKSIEIRLYSSPSSSLFSQILVATADTNISNIILLGEAWRVEAGAKLAIILTSYTVGKVNKTVIAFDEL